jgi:hypothetical protein
MDTQTQPSSFGRRLRARPLLTTGVVVAALAVLGVVWFWFQPQTLLFDDVVDEAFPTVEGRAADDGPQPDPVAEEDAGPAESGASNGPVALATGSFESRSRYQVSGQATFFELPDGSRTLRLEDFESTNGPDLYVYLTSAAAADTDEVIDEDVVDLGLLTGNVGNQNYTIPDEVDLDRYDTVVIWCLRFTVGFGAADLVAA